MRAINILWFCAARRVLSKAHKWMFWKIRKGAGCGAAPHRGWHGLIVSPGLSFTSVPQAWSSCVWVRFLAPLRLAPLRFGAAQVGVAQVGASDTIMRRLTPTAERTMTRQGHSSPLRH